MGLRNPQPVNPEQALAQKLVEMEQRLSNLETAISQAGKVGIWGPRTPRSTGAGYATSVTEKTEVMLQIVAGAGGGIATINTESGELAQVNIAASDYDMVSFTLKPGGSWAVLVTGGEIPLLYSSYLPLGK